MIALIDKFRARFGLPVQGRRMGEAIRMPDLELFVPSLLDLRLRGGGQEIKEYIIIGRPVVLHRVLVRKARKCSGVSVRDPVCSVCIRIAKTCAYTATQSAENMRGTKASAAALAQIVLEIGASPYWNHSRS